MLESSLIFKETRSIMKGLKFSGIKGTFRARIYPVKRTHTVKANGILSSSKGKLIQQGLYQQIKTYANVIHRGARLHSKMAASVPCFWL